MVLTDEDILYRTSIGMSLVKPFNKENITSNGYDLSIDEIQTNGDIFKIGDCNIVIKPLSPFKIMSLETVELPNEIVASLWLRSSYARRGIMATFGFVDAGYCGKIAMSLFNGTNSPFVFEKDLAKKTICQIVFEQLEKKPLENYGTRSGTYQHQKTLRNRNE